MMSLCVMLRPASRLVPGVVLKAADQLRYSGSADLEDPLQVLLLKQAVLAICFEVDSDNAFLQQL